MGVFQTLWGDVGRSRDVRSKPTRPPKCEAMEERKLLNAAWGPPPGFAAGDGAAGPPAWAHVQALNANGAAQAARGHKLGGLRKGPGGHGAIGRGFSPPSAQLQADFQVLQADQQTLEAEIPADLKAAVQADQAVLQTAFASQAPAQRRAMHPGGSREKGTDADPSTHLAADLTAAGVSSDQANAIVADFQNLKTALATTDPTLQAKIAADQAAIVKDGGPAFPAQGPGLPGPGMF